MERVKKGEKYWFISIFFTVEARYESNSIADAELFKANNYFPASGYTPKMVENISSKLRAVLKGADVIEMPSTWEIDDIANNLDSEPFCLHEFKEECITKNHAYMAGFLYGVNWIKSKIVK